MQTNENYLPILTPAGREAGRLYYTGNRRATGRRIERAKKRVKTSISRLCDCDINNDGTGVDARSERLIHEAEKQLYALIDTVCGVHIAQEAFREFRPFASVAGGFWALRVLDALTNIGR